MSADGSAKLKEWGITVLRVVVGVVFLVHGLQKLLIFGFGGVAGFMGQVGILAPALAGVVVTLVELIGGLALVVGLFTRWVAAVLAVEMLVAVLAVHLPGGFFLPSGYEFALTVLAATVALTFAGAGEASVDGVLARRVA